MRIPFSLLTILFTVISATAWNITGVVVDRSREPMSLGTVRVLNADSTAVGGAITNENGQFTITDVRSGRYILEAKYVGYKNNYTDIRVRNANLTTDTIVMVENAEVLEALTVTGIQTPIKVMQDTIEFNADSYRTQPNAVVEDLLRRLPGVEVDSEGKITANGKEVTKILVDGKEFFSDDPKVASKNLPVNMIDKLQVVDRKSDLARMTGVDDGEEETVINLTVKKGMNNGWFGTVEAGYGTDDRYKASFNVNRFWNGNQLTFIGGANNVNDMGFTDGGSRFRRFGGDNGISTTQAFGINFNVGNEEIFRVGGDVMYTHTDRDTRTRQNRQYLFPDSTSFYDSESNSRDKGHNLRADFRMEWKPDSFNSLDFRPNISLNYSDSESLSSSNNYAGIPGLNTQGAQVNKSLNAQNSHGSSFEFGSRLIYNHNFKQRRGRSFSIYADFRTSNKREKENTYSWNRFYLFNDSIDEYDQFADDHTWSNNISARATWTEPIGNVANGNFLTVAYQFSYKWNNADKMTYDRPFLDGIFHDEPYIPSHALEMDETLVWVDSLSNRFRNNYMNQDIRLGFKHVSKATTLEVGLSLVPQMSKSTDLINADKSIPRRDVLNVAPFLRYRYKIGKSRSMNINYRGRSSQPTMTQLQPVADYSNPLNIVQGNPDLAPSFTHNLDFRFQDFNQDAQRSIMVMMRASMTQNSIVSNTTYNSTTGGRFTTYENVNGVWSANLFTMVSFPFRNKSFTFNNHLGGMYNHNVGFNNGLRNNSGNLRLMESFGISWRPENLEIELRPSYSLQVSSNSVQTTANRTVHSYGGTLNFTYTAPFGLVLASDLNFSATRGYAQGYDTDQWMWNATISYQMLRERNLTLSLKAYDLLQQKSNIQRSVNASYIQDALYNSLTRYFMVSVSYKFNTFGKGNEPESRSNRPYGRGDGPQGPPPGGGRPSGPPPGL